MERRTWAVTMKEGPRRTPSVPLPHPVTSEGLSGPLALPRCPPEIPTPTPSSTQASSVVTASEALPTHPTYAGMALPLLTRGMKIDPFYLFAFFLWYLALPGLRAYVYLPPHETCSPLHPRALHTVACNKRP